MLTIISPAKNLDFESQHPTVDVTNPRFLDQSEQLINKLKGFSGKKLEKLMHISKDLAQTNVERYQTWQKEGERPAIYSFAGEVYRYLDGLNLNSSQLAFAQDRLRILSGLYGLLRPLDAIRPHRLEMGTSLPVRRKKNLYQFWDDQITQALNNDMAAAGTDVLINLASTEYFKAVDFSKINGRTITPVFKDLKGDEYKVVMTWAKIARGQMANYIVVNELTDPEDLKGFEPYKFMPKMSTDSEWVFVRN